MITPPVDAMNGEEQNHNAAPRPTKKKPLIISTTTHQAPAGTVFRGYHYLKAKVGLVQADNKHTVCLDTGCQMTLIDKSLVQELRLTPKATNPIQVNGIGSKHRSTEFVTLDVFFENNENEARISIEAHIVDKLTAKLLIGVDVLDAEGFRIDFEQKKTRIASCMGMTFSLDAHTRAYHHPTRIAQAHSTTVIPGHSRRTIRFSSRRLPSDRDYIFEGDHPTLSFYTCWVDANTSYIQAVNDTPKPITITKREKIGNILETDDQHAFLARTECAEISRSVPHTPIKGAPDNLKFAQMERVLPNGVTIYGNDSITDQFEEVAMQYDVWATPTNTGLARLPRDQWMSIPLKHDWEKVMPKPRVYPLSTKDKAVVDRTFNELHEHGKMSWAKNHTPTGYPVFVVWREVNGIRKGRVVVDIRGLNKASEIDVYPAPTQDDIIQMCHGAKYITVLDAKSFFYQWRVLPEHRKRLAVITHRGQEMFNVAIMGYVNSVAYVQRQMDILLKEFAAWCKTYLDDIVIASPTYHDHLIHVAAVLRKLSQIGIRLEPNKAYIGFPEVALLGQRVDALGLTTPTEKLKAIASLQFPSTLQQLETYIGMTGDLRHIVPNYAAKVAPLQERKTRLLQGSPLSGQPRQNWAKRTAVSCVTDKEREAFDALQTCFSLPTALVHWDYTRQAYIDIDASQIPGAGCGVQVYHVRQDYAHKDLTKPPARSASQTIMFLSRTLTSAETRYSATELEVSCVCWMLRKLRRHIDSAESPVVCYTDHSATIAIATSLRTVSSDRSNLRLVRAAMMIQRHNIIIHHRPGTSNKIADALSRLPTSSATPAKESDDLDALCAEAREVAPESYVNVTSSVLLSNEFRDQVIAGYANDKRWAPLIHQLTSLSDDEPRQKIPYSIDDGLLYSTQEDGTKWLCLPRATMKEVFRLIHDEAGHQGFERSRARLNGFVIHHGTRELKKYIEHCPQCLRNGTRRHRPYGELQPIVGTAIPFYTVCIDFVAGLPVSPEGYNQVAFITCKFTKRLGAVAGSKTWTSERWALAMLDFLQSADWGIPSVWISDRDPLFTKGLWKGIFSALRTSMFFTTAYHAQADGQSERSNQSAEIWLRHWCSLHPTEPITKALPSLIAATNSSVSTATNETPHKLMYGFQPRTPWDLQYNALRYRQDFASRTDAAECLKYAAMQMKRQYDARHTPRHFSVGDKVLLRIGRGYNIPTNALISRKLGQQYAGLFTVLERVGRLAYRLDLPSAWKVHPVISVQHLEPAPFPDPFDREAQDLLPTFDERFPNDTDRHDVAKVLDVRHRRIGRYRTPTTEYLIQWENMPIEQAEWVKERDAVGAEEKIAEFLQSRL